ncbi:DinB family protein [Paenibacillus cellulositrophicus]|uniref:DinB family protein n=1 Tax=Paenibacillus cellulositrophicus TaxID=562959 RepID=UPI0020409C39|nr:DinB family protein [Paenibacillus cellulositrophicus]MCM3001897.1 DinB family protein [Paenibacillus cellulositrophicus]
MRNAYLFGQIERVRTGIINKVSALPESKRDIVPDGFNNNIHWHLGHLLVISDMLVLQYSGKDGVIPAEYRPYFTSGTKPADWQGEAPAWDTLISQLTEQIRVFQEQLGDDLNQPVAKADNFAKAETIDELLVMNISHEASHAGTINAMLKKLA